MTIFWVLLTLLGLTAVLICYSACVVSSRENYVPRDYYEAVVEELCHKHTEEIASMPSVVRCEDCKYWLSDKPIKNKWFQNGETDQCKWRTDESPNHDDFCSYGEREGE